MDPSADGCLLQGPLALASAAVLLDRLGVGVADVEALGASRHAVGACRPRHNRSGRAPGGRTRFLFAEQSHRVVVVNEFAAKLAQ